jgi:hypothetical protein
MTTSQSHYSSFDYRTLTSILSFGFKTLERSYLLRINGKVAERPQQTDQLVFLIGELVVS